MESRNTGSLDFVRLRLTSLGMTMRVERGNEEKQVLRFAQDDKL